MEASKKVLFIKNWISNYIDSMPTKAESLVIGISGGIDSSVSSTLSAMTGLRTIVLSMPIKQKSNQHDLSQKHLEWLKSNFKNVEGHTIKLDNLFNEFKSSLSNFDNEHGMANSRARLRMTTLYQVAAANNDKTNKSALIILFHGFASAETSTLKKNQNQYPPKQVIRAPTCHKAEI